MNVRYRIELSQTERAELTAILSSGTHAARRLKRAQILLVDRFMLWSSQEKMLIPQTIQSIRCRRCGCRSVVRTPCSSRRSYRRPGKRLSFACTRRRVR